MQVQAAPGLKVPMEEKPRDYITDEAPVEVIESAYYLRRLADEDLIDVTNAAAIKTKKGAE